MINNWAEIERVKRNHERKYPLTLGQKYVIINAMFEEVRQLGRLEAKSKSITHKITMAKVLNAGI